MDKKKIINYNTIEDFILDKDFSAWVLHPDNEADLFWNSIISGYPEKERQIRDAIVIIRSLQPIDEEVSQQNLDAILARIKKSEKGLKISWNSGLKYAATVAILIAVGGLAYYSVNTKDPFPMEMTGESVLKGKVILADGSIKEFDTDQTTIKQAFSGTLTINADTIDVDSEQTTSALNQVIIPYGKRSEITLADGTHIWLNSGSQLSYPSKFITGSREVYLSGEALFEVKADPSSPFYVITRDIKVKVLGTSFNVSSYADDNTVQTVLLKGKVSAGKNKLFASTINLIPGERLTYDKNNSNLTKDRVDVQLYSSWVNGYLVFKNIPITEVFAKLERFYNQDISVDNGLEKITFSGKLDLGDNLKDVLRNIAFASSVNVQEDNESFTIKK
jgi:transmembrane sensor